MSTSVTTKPQTAGCWLLLLAWQVRLSNSQESCSQVTCRPPTCRCPAHNIPGNLQPEEVPQMVLIAFDDAVNWDNWHFYLRLFPPDGRRKNPNGCPMTATYFVSNNFTDYCMVSKLHARGMEIGDHSVTHKLPRMWWTDAGRPAMEYEVLTQRSNLAEKAKIPMEEIRGWRSPFLQPAGDDLFSVLYDNNFTYDATMTYSFPKNLYSPVLWPFTLDYGYTLVCNIARCPQGRYPGLWILPVVVVMDHTDQKPCAYVDDCANMPGDKNEAYQMLWKNFLRNYRSNRAPLYLNLHSPWLNTQFHLEALDQFLDKMAAMDDVYLVTVHQALQWQMDPHPLGQLQNFTPWQCPHFQPHVEDKTVCSFTYKHKTAPGLNTTGEQVNASYPGNESQAMNNSFVWENPETMLVPSGSPDQTTRASPRGPGRPQKPQRFGGKKNASGGLRTLTIEADQQTTDSGQQTGSGIHHHHRHKTHRPWFLKGSTATTFVSRFSLSTLTFIVCIFYGMIT